MKRRIYILFKIHYIKYFTQKMKTIQILFALSLLIAFCAAHEQRMTPKVEYIGTYGFAAWIINMVKWWIYVIVGSFIDSLGIILALFGMWTFTDEMWQMLTIDSGLKMSAME